MKVTQVRRREVFLPNALVGSLETAPIEHRGDVKQSALAAREIQYSQTVRSQQAPAQGQSLPRVGQVLKDVIEGDDVEAAVARKRLLKGPAVDEVSLVAGAHCHRGI